MFPLNDLLTQLSMGIVSPQFVQFVVTMLFALTFPLLSAAFINYWERKILAWMGDRVGPVHTGPHGSLQLLADIGKMLLKEDVHPRPVDRMLFLLAPGIFMAPIIATFAVLPFSPYLELPGTALAMGLVFLVAMSSLDVVGLIMAGWSSNNKYSLIGGLRAAAQMISYELPLMLSLIGVVMLTSALAGQPGYPGANSVGTISLKEIIGFQSLNWWPGKGIPVFDFLFQGDTPWTWFILVQPLMLLIYYISGLAETNRLPFDLPTAESELVAGFMTEYSGARWAMFFLGEYSNMIIVAVVVTALFLGGWAGPGVGYLTAPGMAPGWLVLGNFLGVFYFIAKVYLLIFIFLWVQGTVPRLRADQLMQFAWLILMPVCFANILLLGLLSLLANSLNWSTPVLLLLVGVINWIALLGFVRLVRGVQDTANRRARAPAIRAQLRLSLARQLATRSREA